LLPFPMIVFLALLYFLISWKMMIKGIIGKKLGMTQVFAEDGAAIGITVIESNRR